MEAKIISSLEKCFLDESIESKPQLKSFSMLKNERYSLCVCFLNPQAKMDWEKETLRFKIEGVFKDFANVYKVGHIPSNLPCYPDHNDDNYIRKTPGLYPDLLEPITEETRLPSINHLHTIWIELEPNDKLEAGNYTIEGVFINEAGEETARVSADVEIIDALLPPQELTYAQWFYTDCLMQYYEVGTWSERHWEIIENFLCNAVRYGQNMILTPLLTPELDTYVGGYRPTTQLVDITLENGEYSFDFSRVKRWVETCQRAGMKYFEINHFFSQWGAKFCPQVVAKVDGEEKRIFGWDDPSDSPRYLEFLKLLIPAFIDYMKSLGVDKLCRFHISDEPRAENLELYKRVSSVVKELIQGYGTMDAVSDYEFYKTGAIDYPVACNDHMDEFIENGVKELWTYYCCCQCEEVSNRFFAMPSARNRIIGTQCYKFGVKGFAHWGYNFYNNQLSYSPINPYICSDAESSFPSGDAYSVYPGKEGKPLPSLRQIVFFDALQDMRAMQLCESLYGKDYVVSLIEEGIEPITFKKYPKSADYILELREKVNRAIKEKLKSYIS